MHTIGITDFEFSVATWVNAKGEPRLKTQKKINSKIKIKCMVSRSFKNS